MSVILQDMHDGEYSMPLVFTNLSDALDALVDKRLVAGQIINTQTNMIYKYNENFELESKTVLEYYKEDDWDEDE